MDMSVSVAPEKQAVAGEAKSDQVRRPNSSDLDEWLAKVEAHGRAQAHHRRGRSRSRGRDHHLSRRQQKSPALLFENIKGHPGHRALYNMIGCNLSRFCLMIGEKPVRHPLEAVQVLQTKMGRKHAPKEVSGRRGDLQPEHRHRRRRSTSGNSRRRACGRSTAANISAPATPSSPRTPRPGASTSAPTA